MRTRVKLFRPSVNALLANDFNCTPCRNPCSDRETIETHFFFPLDFKLKHEITYTAINKCITGKQTLTNTSFNINTQRIDTKPWI